MNTKSTEMLTIGTYQPIAGLGYNTIRKMSPKYSELGIGDIVDMVYCDDDTATQINGVERLAVSAIAMVPWHAFEDTAMMHVEMNHGCWNSDTEFRDFMEECYGPISPDDQFLVIYF